MPRLNDSLTINEIPFVAVRPQNGTLPATLRANEQGKTLVEQLQVNIGAAVDTTARGRVLRLKFSLIQNKTPVDGVARPADRVDVTSRIDAEAPETTIDKYVETLAAFVQSPEFRAAISGQELY